MRNRAKKRAFTLIELLIAISIIAVLAAIALPRFINARHNAYLSACLLNERNLATALQSYSADFQRYPDTLTQLANANLGGHINRLPTCPSGGEQPYGYETNPEGSLFSLHCQGYHHYQLARMAAGFPQYFAISGSIEHP